MPELQTIRSGLDEHLSAAQTIHEQLQQNGSAMRNMNGFCHVSKDDGVRPRMALISMPFLQLKEHGHRTEAQLKPSEIIRRLKGRTIRDQSVAESNSAHTHPSRTLFQYLNPRNNSRRDLKQVVCRMLGPRDRKLLFVSQVWVLIVNEGQSDKCVSDAVDAYRYIELIITSSNLPEKDLFEDLFLTPAAQPTPPIHTVVNIHVQSADGRVWLFDRSDCDTYFVSVKTNSEQHQFSLTITFCRILHHISWTSRAALRMISRYIWRIGSLMHSTGPECFKKLKRPQYIYVLGD